MGIVSKFQKAGGKVLSIVRRGREWVIVLAVAGVVHVVTVAARATDPVLPTINANVEAGTTEFGSLVGTYLSKAFVLGLVVIAVVFLWRKLRRVS